MNHDILKKFEDKCREALDIDESGYFSVRGEEIPYFRGITKEGDTGIIAYYGGHTIALTYTKDDEAHSIKDCKVLAFLSIERVVARLKRKKDNEPTS